MEEIVKNKLQSLFVVVQHSIDLQHYKKAYHELFELVGAVRFARSIDIINQYDCEVAFEKIDNLFCLIEKKL